jgi:hypothetical protein
LWQSENQKEQEQFEHWTPLNELTYADAFWHARPFPKG